MKKRFIIPTLLATLLLTSCGKEGALYENYMYNYGKEVSVNAFCSEFVANINHVRNSKSSILQILRDSDYELTDDVRLTQLTHEYQTNIAGNVKTIANEDELATSYYDADNQIARMYTYEYEETDNGVGYNKVETTEADTQFIEKAGSVFSVNEENKSCTQEASVTLKEYLASNFSGVATDISSFLSVISSAFESEEIYNIDPAKTELKCYLNSKYNVFTAVQTIKDFTELITEVGHDIGAGSTRVDTMQLRLEEDYVSIIELVEMDYKWTGSDKSMEYQETSCFIEEIAFEKVNIKAIDVDGFLFTA